MPHVIYTQYVVNVCGSLVFGTRAVYPATKATTNYKESLYNSTCVSHLNMHERVSVRVSGAEVATHTRNKETGITTHNYTEHDDGVHSGWPS